jgi:hypothetical protein
VPPGCVVSAPELGLSPVGLPPDPASPGEGTFLSGRSLPILATVSCPPPPGEGRAPREPKSPAAEAQRRSGLATEAKPEILQDRGGGMAGRSKGGPRTLASAAVRTPALVPCLMLQRGEVYLPSADGPVQAFTPEGRAYDPFDVVDRLVAEYPLIYLVDLDGVERAEPQLDFLQELSRDATLWVDGGVRTAEQAIDILVTGAQRAVLSSATLLGARELRRAWRLSTELAFELELNARGLVAPGDWGVTDAPGLARLVREVGVDHLVVSPREVDPDWALVGTLASEGPTWVDGSFEPSALPQLRNAGARGGIFHLDRMLGSAGSTDSSTGPLPGRPPRDDET